MRIKNFESFINEAVELDLSDKGVKKFKFKWQRTPAATGRFASFQSNKERSYICSVDGERIGELHNVSFGTFSKDDSRQWHVMLYSSGSNINLKKKFEFEQVDEAKKFFEDDEDDWDGNWGELYDWADGNDIWIKTMI